MKWKTQTLAPALISASVIGLVCLLRILPDFFPHFDFFQRLEWMTYDWRLREAARSNSSGSTNLGFVFISDDSIAAVNDGSLGFQYGLYWPRHVYGRLLKELSDEGAKAVAMDVLFGELRPDHAPVAVGGNLIESDNFFARESKQAGNVILAATPNLIPPGLFLTNCLDIGDISAEKDSDGVLRRAKAFRDYRIWNSLVAQIAREAGLDLSRAKISSGEIEFQLGNGQAISVKMDANGTLDLAELVFQITGERSSQPLPRVKAFENRRVWQLGIVLAASELNADLSQSIVEKNRIILRGKLGQRTIPVDHKGFFYIDWAIAPNSGQLTTEPVESLLEKQIARENGHAPESRFSNALVVIGSTATGNDLTDRGATPLEKDTFLVGKHWNIAHSVLTGKFVRRSSVVFDLLLIAFLGSGAALITWKSRAISGSLAVLLATVAYVLVCLLLFLRFHFWLPMVLPVVGALITTHICLVTWRARHEQREKRRIKSVFSKIVSPNVVNELLRAENLSLGGARREITIYFADIRGFTEMTDSIQAQAEDHVQKCNLSSKAAEEYFDEIARETLATVNLYLATIADVVKKYSGTLDKYIGDCVMAFWGAPTPNEQHAVCAVRAAIDSQRAIAQLNEQRAAENERRKEENLARMAGNQNPLPMLFQLNLGTGINSGLSTVGLMGSDAHILNYTVFGREVNLASRLEGVSGRSRIIIGEGTYRDLQKHDSELAATCIALPPVAVKGFRRAIKIYEVPWKISEENAATTA